MPIIRDVLSRFRRFVDENRENLGAGILAEIAELLRLDPSTVSKKASGVRHWKTSEANAVLELFSKKLSRPVAYDEVFSPAPIVDPVPVMEG